ncbi:putative phage abortive infection protein [Aliarcobacter butzleri]|uniref:putative phage abortive infection protein n=1 Tax=Aliarcobacter butzleri TaxID=28197 RepID=UPI0021B657A0|nr:putative phage abortive infection protein [Aliarcobacter butzleri]MCT7578801.1 putative phage abortive infection protein [Aliarcobacter butzleri]
MVSKEKNSSKLDFLNKILYGAIAIFIILVVAYFIFIIKLDDAQKGNWGTFGDFIGGTLNPIFALFSLFAIIYTIKIQTKELELSREELESTREELKESRIAQQEQSESLKLQNKATKLQIFENTFFQLLNQHNEYLDLLIEEKCLEQISFIENKYINGFPQNNGPIKKAQIYEEFKLLNYKNSVVKNYYMILYQLLKFIDEKSEDTIVNAKQYTNILRALIDNEVLKILAVNCEAYNFNEYKKYIEKYAFFEHIYIDSLKDETKTILNILSLFDKKAFGKNEHILKLFDKLNIN